MPARVELTEALPPVRVPGRVLNALFEHAREAHPEECCGLVLGDDRERYQVVFRCRNDMSRKHRSDPARHPRDGTEAFWMNEQDYQQAERQAERTGLRVTAVYHSHVDVGVYLSELDLEYAESPLFPFLSADQIVLSVVDGVVKGVGVFRREPGGPFAGRRVGLS